MAHYYFNLSECGDVTPDPEGREFTSFANAQKAALFDARTMMAAEIIDGQLQLECHIGIEDGEHTPLLSIPFGLAVNVLHGLDGMGLQG